MYYNLLMWVLSNVDIIIFCMIGYSPGKYFYLFLIRLVAYFLNHFYSFKVYNKHVISIFMPVLQEMKDAILPKITRAVILQLQQPLTPCSSATTPLMTYLFQSQAAFLFRLLLGQSPRSICPSYCVSLIA